MHLIACAFALAAMPCALSAQPSTHTDLNATPYMAVVTAIRRGSLNWAGTLRKRASAPP